MSPRTDLAKAVIDKQLRGVYRILVRIGSPESVIKRIAAIHENHFENVRVGREFLAERRAVVRPGPSRGPGRRGGRARWEA